MRHHSRRVWLADSSPAPIPEDQSREVVGQPNEAALTTLEDGLLGAVRFRDVPALGACLTGVGRVHEQDRDACPSRLVRGVGLQLPEGPGVQRPPLGSRSPDPRADVLQVLEDDPSLRAFGHTDDALADTVVDVVGLPLLLSAAHLQQPLCAPGPDLLKFAPKTIVTPSHPIDGATGVDDAIRIGGDVDHAAINADPVVGITFWGIRLVNGRQQVPAPVSVHQIALAALADQQGALTVTADERDGLPPVYGPDRDGITQVAEDARVVGDAAERPERTSSQAIRFVGIGHFRQQPDDDLGGQAEVSPDGLICPAVQIVLTERSLAPRQITEPVSRCVRSFERADKALGLFGSRAQLNLSDQFQGSDPLLRFDIPLDRRRRHIACRPAEVRTGPERWQSAAQGGEFLAQYAAGPSFQRPHDQVRTVSWPAADEQVDMVWLYGCFDDRPVMLAGNLCDDLGQAHRDLAPQYRATVLRAPHEVVVQEVYGVSSVPVVHTSDYTAWHLSTGSAAVRGCSIPPLAKARGLLGAI